MHLSIFRGVVSVYDDARVEPHHVSEVEACRAILAHDALRQAVAELIPYAEGAVLTGSNCPPIHHAVLNRARAALALCRGEQP